MCVCFLAIVILHVKLVHLLRYLWFIRLCHFSTLSLKQHDFRKNVIQHKMCVFISCRTFACNICCFKKNSARYCHKCMYVGLHVKCLLLLSDFNKN